MRVLIERQLVDKTSHPAVPMVEVGQPARITRVILIVDARQKRDAGRRDVVDRIGVRVGALKIEALREVMRDRQFESVEMGIRDRGKRFVRGRIDAKILRARLVVRDGILGDCVRRSILSRDCQAGRKTWLSQQLRLFRIIGNAEMRAFRPDVTEFDEPVRAELALHRQVPLLRRRRDPMQRDFEANVIDGDAGKHW